MDSFKCCWGNSFAAEADLPYPFIPFQVRRLHSTSQNKNKIEMNDSGITIKSDKDITLEAGGNVTIKGSKVDIK